MVFVVSTGRSGTTTVAHLLSAFPGVTCLHEPEPALIREAAAYRYGEIAPEEITAVLRATRPFDYEAELYCESSQTLALLLPLLAQSFPTARYVWLLRNGLDFVASAMQKQWYTGHSEHDERYEAATAVQQAWIDGRLRGDRCGAMSAAEWRGLTRFARCCWYWRYVNDLIAADLQRHAPDAYFLLRLETLATQLPGLLDWLGVAATELPSLPHTNLAKRPPYHWRRWKSSERETFVHWCGGLMDVHYPGWRTAQGLWRGVVYETPPQRRPWRYWWHRLRRFLRAQRAKMGAGVL